MKIKTLDRSAINNTVNFGGIKIKFNGEFADVEDTVGKDLIEKYNGMLIDANAPTINTEKKPKQNFKTNEEIRLENLLAAEVRKNQKLTEENLFLQEDVKIWKDLYGKKKNEYDSLKKGLGESVVVEKNEIPENDSDDFETMIENATYNKLKKICKDMDYPEPEWCDFKTKKELKDYLLSKV